MKLYLVRHGAYRNDYSTEGGPGLSERGFAQARAAGAFLAKQGARPEVVLTSTYLRAQETARTIQEMLGTAIDPIVSRDFTPGGDPDTMRSILAALPAKEVLVVGHMCSIGDLAHTLCPMAPFAFDTCTVVALEGNDPTWTLRWVNNCGREIPE